MSVKVSGVDDILKNIEAKFGKAKTTRIVNKALKETGDEIVEITKAAVSSYMDTGATYDEVVRSNVKGSALGIKEVSVGWRGDKDRWRLVHLNEFGYVRKGRFISPRGMGKVQSAADKAQQVAFKRMRSGLEELAK
ncbi:hypothetical protein ACFQOY_13665 [Enterococcus alcedinis]|uniref:HK97 gp10 family phage protein n=1 Tax=Enterococcus alcedinis TaxID=1274384 RepID=A0A917JDH1_9ENTE|nr:hypothetical protein [Enterococcus alcedinis]MBP2100963.1 hypothetical protein [Enterococcus alcedinis]GGI64741.1 hypothetical protein GCM10011482_03950 [Enterococcus alcedinis]